MKKKLTSLILAIVLLASQSPAFAIGLEMTDDATASLVKEAEILAEDVSKRDEFEKHYIRSDGTFVAVTYDNAVHYKDENGVWQDVDNRVKYDAVSGKYTTSTPVFKAEFASPSSKGELVSLTNGENTISWGLSVTMSSMVAATETARLVSNTVSEPSVSLKNATKATTDEIYDLKNVVGGIGYTNVFSNAPEISVDYSVSHNKIEEDVYINAPTSVRSFKMEMNVGDLTAHVNSDGSVSITDSDGNEKYRIGIPYMADANDAVLTNIDVTVTQNDGSCTVTYTPNEAWLTSEDREYPILFDPSITTSEYAANVYDTYVYQGNTANHSGEQRIYIGVMNSKVYRTYITFGKLPSIDSTMPIISASLTFTMHHTTTTGKTTELRKVMSGWNQSTITYAKQPSYSGPIATSAYNASTNKHVFDITDDITDYYAGINNYPESDGSFHGYLFKYVDETLTNPDYNAPYSSEVSTRAYRPALTVVYGYSLPSGFNTNSVYSFINYDTHNYMTVFGGTDANDVNVCMSLQNNRTSQQFTLVQAANGGYYIRAVCSSNNRVLDIYKNDATGYVENGCNVQIYNPTDPLAQEWFIVGAEYGCFKIVPRTDMTLALTGNDGTGSADGRTATSAGNVYVSTYTGAYNQLWMIFDRTQNNFISPASNTLSDGKYYLNNRYSGKYLHMTSTLNNVDSTSGSLASLGTSICWKITHVGNDMYTIRYEDNAQAYLWVESSSSSALSVGAMSGSNLDNRYLWRFINVAGEGCLIQNVGTGLYIYGSGSVSLHSTLPVVNTPSYESFVWRCADIDVYGSCSTCTQAELQSFTASLTVAKDGDNAISITPNPANSKWVSSSDFTYFISDTSLLSYNSTTGQFEGKGTSGTVYVTATHKATLKSVVFTAYIVEFDEGTYFFQNRETEKYMQPDNDDAGDNYTSSGVILEQMTFDGEDYQRWNLSFVGSGYYSIENDRSGYAITVPSGKEGNNNTNLILSTYTGTQNQKWDIIKTENGSYKVKAWSAKNYLTPDLVLAVEVENIDDLLDHLNIQQNNYLDNDSYKDEWYLKSCVITINPYYDLSFNHRYTESQISQCSQLVQDVFWEFFGITVIFNTPQCITSTPDHCLIANGLPIDSYNIKTSCPANPSKGNSCAYYDYNLMNNYSGNVDKCKDCTDRHQLFNDFIPQYPGTKSSISMLFTGHRLFDEDGEFDERSFCRPSAFGICIQEWVVDPENYYEDTIDTIIHEISHAIGAKDHYHEINENGDCVGGDLCLVCNPDSVRPEWCIMCQGVYNNDDVMYIHQSYNPNHVFCSGCIEDISDYIYNNFYK